MTDRDDRGDVKQTTTGFRGPLMVQSLTSAKSKFLSLNEDFETLSKSLFLDALVESFTPDMVFASLYLPPVLPHQH